MKEKEHLDIADTNTLLLHPTHFSITNPSSPGGIQNGRKTRRQKGEAEGEPTNGGYPPDGINRRKRKGFDDDSGSPSREGIITPAERAKAKQLAHQTAPLYSINTLFTEKELTFQTHQAHIATRHFFSVSHKDGNDTNGSNKRPRVDSDEEANTVGSEEQESGQEENGDTVEAPEMGRTASQQTFHVTRSTRAGPGMAGLNILSDLAEKAVTRPALPYATLYSHQPRNGPTTFLPAPSRAMPEETEEDFARLAESLDKSLGCGDRKAMEDALRPPRVGEGRSTLAPDWPAYLEVHLVDVNRPTGMAR